MKGEEKGYVIPQTDKCEHPLEFTDQHPGVSLTCCT